MIERHAHMPRLMQLVSPSLPTGAFAYSQGLEWAIAADWIQDTSSLKAWLADLMRNAMAYVDIPLLSRMYAAGRATAATELARWCDDLLALRESHELRMEERQRGRAMLNLLEGLQVPIPAPLKAIMGDCQLAGFALAAVHWNIALPEAALGYVWSWLENQVLTGIKTIPLGQTEGHRLLLQLDSTVLEAVERGLQLTDDEIGASSPALALAGSLHETLYTRLYRS